ncbi:MAG: hypothetical protein IAE79_05885 [Anaerolinea sp.]|nr:hypothetical protein [Anaerolinea sp.]
MLPPFAKSVPSRDDHEELAQLEEEGARRIAAALRAQQIALELTPGGVTVDATLYNIRSSLDRNSGQLLDALTAFLAAAAAVGIETAVASIPYVPAVGFSWELANQAAADFVNGYAFDLVTGINNTTEAKLRGVMQRWILDGGTLDELADGVRPIFAYEPDTAWIERLLGIDRGYLIAETEATRAYVEGKVSAYTSSNLADYPPQKRPPDDSHPRCRCDVVLDKMADGSWHWIWLTAFDELVCDYCGPLHMQSVGLAKDAPGG